MQSRAIISVKVFTIKSNEGGLEGERGWIKEREIGWIGAREVGFGGERDGETDGARLTQTSPTRPPACLLL